jgi:hypothetical protein
MRYLLQAFPNAQFHVHVAAVAETEQFASPRIRLNKVGSGAKAWSLFAFRLMLMKPMPTLFLAGENRLREGRWLSQLWPMSDPIVMQTMDHLVAALRRLSAGTNS